MTDKEKTKREILQDAKTHRILSMRIKWTAAYWNVIKNWPKEEESLARV